MRDYRTLELSPGEPDQRPVTVHELRVRDVRKLLDWLTPERQQQDLLALLREGWPELMRMGRDCLVLPADLGIEDLSLSECEQIAMAWLEMNQSFFDRLAGALGYEIVTHTAAPTSSTAPH